MPFNCIDTLIRNEGTLDFANSRSFAQAKLLDKSASSRASWDSSMSIPIRGLPVEGTGNAARETMEHYFENTAIKWDDQRLLSIATQTLSKEAVQSFDICMRGQLQNGVRVYVSDATTTDATVTVRWIAAPRVGSPVPAKIQLYHCKAKTELPTEWNNNEELSFVVERMKGRDAKVIANIGGQSDKAFIAYEPAIKITADRRTRISEEIILQNDGTGNNVFRTGLVYAADGYLIDPSTVGVNIVTWVGNIVKGSTRVDIVRKEDGVVEWEAALSPRSKEGGGEIKFNIQFTETKWAVQEA